MSLISRSSSAVSVACALVLAACGGGDGAADAAPKNEVPAPTAATGPSAPYVGTWKGCTLATDAEASWSGAYTFARVSDTQASYHFVKQTFTSLDCSGTAEGTLTMDGEVTWSGKTRAVAGVNADEVLFVPMNFKMSGNMTFNGSPTAQFKQVLAINANELREGDRQAALDAEGYPAEFSAIQYVNDAIPAPPPPPPPPPPAVAPPPPPPVPAPPAPAPAPSVQ